MNSFTNVTCVGGVNNGKKMVNVVSERPLVQTVSSKHLQEVLLHKFTAGKVRGAKCYRFAMLSLLTCLSDCLPMSRAFKDSYIT